MNISIDRVLLQEQAAIQGVLLDDVALDRFSLYARLLCEWNKTMNLTAITQPEEIVYKHFIDSLTLAPFLSFDLGRKISLIDVGTGAGFPGVPLMIAFPSLELTLLDSLKKRLGFLDELCKALELEVSLVHARAEEAGRNPALREQFDIATARAVAALPVLCEYCLPFVRVGGQFIAMKGPDGENEAAAGRKAAKTLGGNLERIVECPIGEGEQSMDRRLLIFEKRIATPQKYPRSFAKIKKQPL